MKKFFVLATVAMAVCASTAFAYTPRVSDGVGVTEWEEWTFATPEFWVAADNQGRDQFTKGTGVIAIADPDEWDDVGSPGGGFRGPGDEAIGFNSQLMTPNFAVTAGTPVVVQFDYSWRPEDSQQAYVRASGVSEPLLDLNTGNTVDSSDPATNPDINGTYTNVVVPTSGEMSLAFEMVDAGNDWWFAIDNVTVLNAVDNSVLFSENFDGLADSLGTVLDDESGDLDGVVGWTQEAPEGWSINTDDFVSTGPIGGPLGVKGVFGLTRVPEPSTFALLGLSLAGLLGIRRRS